MPGPISWKAADREDMLADFVTAAQHNADAVGVSQPVDVTIA
ncbi:MAG: hypothetical protein ACTHXI_00755 [Halomonadaceae bacterium]|nr:hypothetical protein [Halomonas sp.]